MTLTVNQICQGVSQVDFPSTKGNEDKKAVAALQDLLILQKMLQIAKDATGAPDREGTITYYGEKLTKADFPIAYDIYIAIHNLDPERTATRKVKETIAKLVEKLSKAGKKALPAAESLSSSQLENLRLTGNDAKVLEDLKKLVKMLEIAKQATGNETTEGTLTYLGHQLSGVEPNIDGVYDIYIAIHQQKPERSATRKVKMTIDQVWAALPQKFKDLVGAGALTEEKIVAALRKLCALPAAIIKSVTPFEIRPGDKVKFVIEGESLLPVKKVKQAVLFPAGIEITENIGKKMTTAEVTITKNATAGLYTFTLADERDEVVAGSFTIKITTSVDESKLTRLQKAADVVHNKLKLEAKAGGGPAGFLAGPGQSRMPLANRAAAERPNVVVGLRMSPTIIGPQTEDGKPFKKNDKHEVTIPVEVGYAQEINKGSRDAIFASVKAGAIYRYNPKGLSPEAYLFYNFTDNRLRYPNTYLPTGSSHRLTPGLALNIPLKHQLGVRVFSEAQQEWFDYDSTVLGYPFGGQSLANRSGAELIFNWSKLGDKKKAPYLPNLSLALAGLAGRREFPDRMPGYQGSVYSPFWGVEGELKADWKKSSLKPYVAVGGSYRSYEGWNPTSEVYARGGINIKQAGEFSARVGHISNLTPYYAGQEGSKTSLNLTYSPPEKLGWLSAFFVSLGYDHYKDGQNNGYNQFSAIFGVDLVKLIFGAKTKVASDSEATAQDFMKQGAQARTPAEAIKAFSQAIDVEPNNASAYMLRGLAYSAAGAYAEAARDLTIAINLSPEPKVAAAAYYGRALANDKLDKKDEALSDYGKACGLNKEFLQKPGPNTEPNAAQQQDLLTLIAYTDEKCEETADPQKCKDEVGGKIKFWHKKEDIDREVAKYPKKEEKSSAPPAPPKAPEKPTKTEKPAPTPAPSKGKVKKAIKGI